MLVFIDESYQQKAVGDVWTALAAICVPKESCRDIARELFKLKKRFWHVREPDEMELKGSKLLNARGVQSPRNRDFIQEIISLCKLYKLTPFAVAQHHPEGLELSRLRGKGILPDLHKGLVRRVHQFLADKHPERLGILAFDERDRQTNRHISRAFRNYLFKSKEAQEFEQIVETPFFYDSEITPAGEIVDIVAYLMCARYAGRKNDSVLEKFFMSFRDLSYSPQAGAWSSKRLWGFSALGVDPS
ncbi:MAG: DUF3800 domain-containing protein [Phycisphaerae bacterium]|nr:DUF3800 domain-containing protein [Phycisphaerae bacterium]